MVDTRSSAADGAPPLAFYLTDPVRAAAEYGLFLATAPIFSRLPTGDGHPVLVLPGLLAADSSTRTLRGVLRRLGYQVHGWRLGRNIGPTAEAVRGMRDRLDELGQRHGRAVTLLGWSLGGIFARDLARSTPDAVRQVITLGSPFRLARHGQSRARRAFERYSHLHVEHKELPLEGSAAALTVPATSIYSHFDGIVAWQACLDVPSPLAENIAVFGSHFGFGHHPAVVWAVADRLAQPEGAWTPFRPPPLLRYAFPRPDAPAAPAPTGAAA